MWCYVEAHNEPRHTGPMILRLERYTRPYRRLTWTAPFLAVFAVPSAHAQWSIVIADVPATVMRGTNLYLASANQVLDTDDIVESGASGILLLQDDAGDVMELGPGTQALLESQAHVSLLNGWVKLSNDCTASCTTPVVETERGTLTIGDHAAAIVAVVPTGPGSMSEVFSESGTQKLNVFTNDPGAPASVNLAEEQFASIAPNAAADLRPRPSSTFLAGMPIAFRDALRRVSVVGTPRNDLPTPLRPVSFADVSAWLTSALPARNQPETRFFDRFRPRLADTAFQQQVERNLHALPEWQVALQPAVPPQPSAKVAPKSLIVKAPPRTAEKGTPLVDGSASAPSATDASKESGNWLTRFFKSFAK
jgi:hypothetical protein